ncbi:hypothetical protein KC19_2G087700 [Ceratodon purpureus]|uniref:Glycosyltransferase n=1 Tax=Ceratodon purpureus TaxID=3225 RepID=A0A8T0IUP4_CERPU|nr:hypothetical protein KC19_2G087700 [Ceratodon purpureus]
MGGDGGELNNNEVKVIQPKPHVVLLTMPAPGHMFPTIALGKVLARQGVKVTFLSSGCVAGKLLRVVEEEEELDMSIGTVLEDPLPEPENPLALVPWVAKLPPDEMVEHAYQLIQKLSPPACCIISDVFLPWTKELAEKLGIPRHFLVTMSASALSFMFSVPHFADQGLLPLEPSTEVEFPVPGVGNVAKGDVWEYFVKGNPFQFDPMIQCLQCLTESFPTATYLVNSTEELEPKVFRALTEPVPFTGQVAKVVSIGPLEQSFAFKGGEADSFELTEAAKSKKLSSEVEEWLDAQPDSSVLYISFGTIFSPQAEQVLELAHGLEASGQRFLWIIRLPDVPHIMVSKQPTKEEISAILPPGFEERTKGRGLLQSSWAPQPKILSHRAVGLFMSHCGWNSILEAISTSTPILGRPCFVDQWLNATFLEDKFQIGTILRDTGEGGFDRGRIETGIRLMMEGEEGRVARRNVARLNKVLRDAVTPSSGPSSKNLEQYVGEIFAMARKLNLSHVS